MHYSLDRNSIGIRPLDTPQSTVSRASSRYTPATAIAVVIANMVGTGVFTSIGYQIIDIKSSFALLLLWLVGGLAALCGALTYAELASRIPRSGGEYNFLSQLYHPSVGFVSGWVSFTVGFAAPTALAAMTFAAYLDSSINHIVEINRMAAALALVVVITFVHGRNHNASGGLQNWFTIIKVLLIAIFVVTVVATVTEPPIWWSQLGERPAIDALCSWIDVQQFAAVN